MLLHIRTFVTQTKLQVHIHKQSSDCRLLSDNNKRKETEKKHYLANLVSPIF